MYLEIGLAAVIRSSSQKPACLYRRCSAAKPRNCSDEGWAHFATKNRRDTNPESWISKEMRKTGPSLDSNREVVNIEA